MQFILTLAIILPLLSGQQQPFDVGRTGRAVTAPTIVSKVDPEYSEAARAAGIQGTVVLETLITEDGSPQVLRVVKGMGYGLDENAIAAVERWRFKPATKEGTAVRVSLKIEVNFNLEAGIRVAPQTVNGVPSSTNVLAGAGASPERAVQAWYRAFEGAAGRRAQYGGYVGGRFNLAYGLLAAALKNRISDEAFEETYAELANLKLLQAQLARVDDQAGNADVFVEEERTVVFNGSVPAVAWYDGVLHLTRNGSDWQIAEIDLHPEDLISVNFGGHSPWRNDPIEVARVAVQPLYHVSALPESCVTAKIDVASGIADIDVCGDSRDVVRVVRLHSGEWHVVKIESRR